MARHTFTEDWFSSRVPTFEKHLVHLRDKRCRALEAEEREAIRARCAALAPENGAMEAARMVEEFAFMRRADRGCR